jgi:hypothetical protein
MYRDIDNNATNVIGSFCMQSPNLRYIYLVVLVAAIATPHDALAYVDPNSAGLLYQIFFPIVVAATLAWRWIKRWIKETAIWLWQRIRRPTD